MSTELDTEVKDNSYAPADDFLPQESSRLRRMWRAALWGTLLVLIVGASVPRLLPPFPCGSCRAL